MTTRAAVIAAGLSAFLAASSAAAESGPIRLRANALATAESPAGLLTLEASGEARSWLSAEALVWMGTEPERAGNALVVAVIARDPERRARARVGRFVAGPGAVRPTHMDGASARAALPWGDVHAEAFGGVPVFEGADGRTYGWIAGGRLSRPLGRWGSIGVGYMQRRDAGRLADEELAFDAGMAASEDLDLALRGAYDLSTPGISEARALASWRVRDYRLSAFALHRSPSRLLPATSLFSVLGDAPSQRIGGRGLWRAAPRLDLVLQAAASHVAGDLGADLEARGTLRLDPRGRGATTLGVRRQNAPLADYTGIRATARVPVSATLGVMSELEIAFPDEPGDRGRAWPWGLVGVRYAPDDAWRAALALEAGASPRHRFRTDALMRVSRSWEGL